MSRFFFLSFSTSVSALCYGIPDERWRLLEIGKPGKLERGGGGAFLPYFSSSRPRAKEITRRAKKIGQYSHTRSHTKKNINKSMWCQKDCMVYVLTVYFLQQGSKAKFLFCIFSDYIVHTTEGNSRRRREMERVIISLWPH